MHERLCELKDLIRLISRLEDSIRESYGVTLTEALILCSVCGGSCSAAALAEDVKLSPSRLSRVLSALQAKGLVDRNRRTSDKRNWDNAPTAAGTALLERFKEEGIEIPDELIALGNAARAAGIGKGA